MAAVSPVARYTPSQEYSNIHNCDRGTEAESPLVTTRSEKITTVEKALNKHRSTPV
jgi:hypothetical protein